MPRDPKTGQFIKASKGKRGGGRPRLGHRCAICHKSFTNLPNHMLLKHGQADGGGQGSPAGQAAELTAADLLGGGQGSPAGQASATVQAYACLGCGASVAKGENPCPKCGQQLVWDGIP